MADPAAVRPIALQARHLRTVELSNDRFIPQWIVVEPEFPSVSIGMTVSIVNQKELSVHPLVGTVVGVVAIHTDSTAYRVRADRPDHLDFGTDVYVRNRPILNKRAKLVRFIRALRFCGQCLSKGPQPSDDPYR